MLISCILTWYVRELGVLLIQYELQLLSQRSLVSLSRSIEMMNLVLKPLKESLLNLAVRYVLVIPLRSTPFACNHFLSVH